MTRGRASWLLIIGEREGLAWVLREQRMAFTRQRRNDARTLARGDRLFIYTTRGCFHNPTRDRGRVIGEAAVVSGVSDLIEPIELAERTFTVGCQLRIDQIAPLGDGVQLAPLVPRLGTFPDPVSWSARMRQPLLRLAEEDVAVISEPLKRLVRPRQAVIAEYVAAASRTVANVVGERGPTPRAASRGRTR
jgi:hypothetical protein